MSRLHDCERARVNFKPKFQRDRNSATKTVFPPQKFLLTKHRRERNLQLVRGLFHDLCNKKMRVWNNKCANVRLRNRASASWDWVSGSRENFYFSRVFILLPLITLESCISFFSTFFSNITSAASVIDCRIDFLFYARAHVSFIPFDISFFRDPSINCYRDATFFISYFLTSEPWPRLSQQSINQIVDPNYDID